MARTLLRFARSPRAVDSSSELAGKYSNRSAHAGQRNGRYFSVAPAAAVMPFACSEHVTDTSAAPVPLLEPSNDGNANAAGDVCSGPTTVPACKQETGSVGAATCTTAEELRQRSKAAPAGHPLTERLRESGGRDSLTKPLLLAPSSRAFACIDSINGAAVGEADAELLGVAVRDAECVLVADWEGVSVAVAVTLLEAVPVCEGTTCEKRPSALYADTHRALQHGSSNKGVNSEVAISKRDSALPAAA